MSIPSSLSLPFIDVFADAMEAGQYVIRQESEECPYARTSSKPAHFKTRQITEICQTCLDSLSRDTSSRSLATRISALKKLDTALNCLVARIEHSIRQRWWYFLLSLFGYRARAPDDIQALLLYVRRKQAELMALSSTSARSSTESDLSESGDEERQLADKEVANPEPVRANEGERIAPVEITNVSPPVVEEVLDPDEADLSTPERVCYYLACLERDLDEKACRRYLESTLWQEHGCKALFRAIVDRTQTNLATTLLPVLSDQQLLLLEQAYQSRRLELPPAVSAAVIARFGQFTARDCLAFVRTCALLHVEDFADLKGLLYSKVEEKIRNQNIRAFVDSLSGSEVSFLLHIIPKHNRFSIPRAIWSACVTSQPLSPEKERGLRAFLQGASNQTIKEINAYFFDGVPRFHAHLYSLFNSEQRAIILREWLNTNVEEAVLAMDAICRRFPDDAEMWKDMFTSIVQWSLLQGQTAQQTSLYRALGAAIPSYCIEACITSFQSMEAQHVQAFWQEVFPYVEYIHPDSLRKLGTFPEQEAARCLEACEKNPKLFFQVLFAANWQTIESWNLQLRRGLERVARSPQQAEKIGEWASVGLTARETELDARVLSAVLGQISVDVDNQEALSRLYQAINYAYRNGRIQLDFSYFDPVNFSLFVHSLDSWNAKILRQLDAVRLPQLLAHLPVSGLENLASVMRSWSPEQIARLFYHLTPELQGKVVFKMVLLTKGNHGFLEVIPPLYDKERSPLLKVFIDQSLSNLDLNRTQLMPILYFADFVQYRLLKDYADKVISWIGSSTPTSGWRRTISEGMQRSIATFLSHHPTLAARCQQFSPDRFCLALLEPSDYPAFIALLTPQEKRQLFGVYPVDNMQSIERNLASITPEGICVSHFLTADKKEAWMHLYPQLSTLQLLAVYEFIDPLDKQAMIPHLGVEPLLGLINLLSVNPGSSESEKSLCIQTLLQRLFADQETLPKLLTNQVWSKGKQNLLWSTEQEVLGQVLRLMYHLDSFYESIQRINREELKATVTDLQVRSCLTRFPHSATFLDSLLTRSADSWGWQEVLVAKLVLGCLQFTEQDSQWETLDLMRYAHVAQIHRLQNALESLKHIEAFAPFASSLQELVGMVAQKFEEDGVIEQLRGDVNARAIFNREIGLYYLGSGN